MIAIKNLSKKYGQKTVVNNVNVEVKKGKITSLLVQMVPVKVHYYRP